MRIIKGVVLFIFLVILFFLVFTLYTNLTAQIEYFKPSRHEENLSFQNGNLQFYSSMRFQYLPIKYRVDVSCSKEKTDRIKEAFYILAEKTNLSFVEVKEAEYIFISCNESHNQEPDGRNMFIAGEGGPLDIIRTGLFHLISKSKILLLGQSKCEKPNIEIHEILHALGFDHSENKNSILYPISTCQQEITQDVIDEIKRVYSFPSLPDLKIESVNASKKGRYLNFNLSTKNQGLEYVDGVFVSVYAEDEEIDFFDLSNITVGGTKILRVENLRLPSSKIKSLTFFVDFKNEIQEINENNNKISLYSE